MRILTQSPLVACLLLCASPALAKDIYVWGSSTGGQSGTSFETGYSKVSTALVHAATGDVIYVKSPLCEDGTIVVNKRVTLIGAIGASYICANVGTSPVMRVTADDVKLHGLSFVLGGRYGSQSGIDASSAARVTVEETAFRFTSTIGGAARGIILSTGKVQRSSFTDYFAVAIEARGTADITDNTFTKTRTAIVVTNASPTIARNTFSELPLAIDVAGGGPKIEKNSFSLSSGGIGVQLANSSAWVFDNEFRASFNTTGVVVRADRESPYIGYNTIKTTRGVDIAGGGARVFNNFFESLEGVRVARSQTVVAHNTFQSMGADVKDVACVQSGPKHDTTLVVNNLFFKGRNAYSGIGGCQVKVQTNVVCSDAATPFSGSYLDGGGNRTRQTCAYRGFARTDPMVDMGTALGYAWLRDDLTHALRDGKPDAGAYEYLPAIEIRRAPPVVP